VTVNWTGGDPASDVEISGSVTVGQLTVFFNCFAPASAQTFTVPAFITQAMPAGSGTLTLVNQSAPVKFTAQGLDFGTAQVEETYQANVSYQ
jgi:hypothetical protein